MPWAKMEMPLSTPKVWASMLLACSKTGTCALLAAATISFIRSALGTGKLRSRPNPRSKNVFTQIPPPLRIRCTAARGVCVVGSSLAGKFSVGWIDDGVGKDLEAILGRGVLARVAVGYRKSASAIVDVRTSGRGAHRLQRPWVGDDQVHDCRVPVPQEGSWHLPQVSLHKVRVLGPHRVGDGRDAGQMDVGIH